MLTEMSGCAFAPIALMLVYAPADPNTPNKATPTAESR